MSTILYSLAPIKVRFEIQDGKVKMKLGMIKIQKAKTPEQSFASHEKSSCWHPDKNKGITPQDVMKGCDKKFWFQCDKCPHVFDKSLDSITGKKVAWCPYCAGQKLCEDACQLCYNKSFANHEKASCWHPTKSY